MKKKNYKKTMLARFIEIWFLAASPIKQSVSVKATQEGVVMFPCSLAIVRI